MRNFLKFLGGILGVVGIVIIICYFFAYVLYFVPFFIGIVYDIGSYIYFGIAAFLLAILLREGFQAFIRTIIATAVFGVVYFLAYILLSMLALDPTIAFLLSIAFASLAVRFALGINRS